MIYSALICDEGPCLSYEIECLYRAFETGGNRVTINSWIAGEELKEKIAAGEHWDVYLLNIDSVQNNNIEMASYLRKMDPHAAVLLMSNVESRIFEIVSLGVYRFLRQSNLKEDLKEAIESYLCDKNFTPYRYVTTIQAGTKSCEIDLENVLYIEAQDKNVEIIGKKTKQKIRYKISDLEEQFQEKRFLRIHRSYLVNLRYVSAYKAGKVSLTNGKELPVGRCYRYRTRQEIADSQIF